MSTQSDLQQLPYIQVLIFLCPPCVFGGVFNLACMLTYSPACAWAYACGIPLPFHQDLKTSGGMNLEAEPDPDDLGSIASTRPLWIMSTDLERPHSTLRICIKAEPS